MIGNPSCTVMMEAAFIEHGLGSDVPLEGSVTANQKQASSVLDSTLRHHHQNTI